MSFTSFDGEQEDFKISTNHFNQDCSIYSLKLADDLVDKLNEAFKSHQTVKFILSNENDVNKLMIGTELVQFKRVKEAQPVQLVEYSRSSAHQMRVLGTIGYKLNPKQELEAKKAEVIRQRSQAAEVERLSRKTLELKGPPAAGTKLIKRSRSNIPSVPSTPSSISTKDVLATPGYRERRSIDELNSSGPDSPSIQRAHHHTIKVTTNNGGRVGQAPSQTLCQSASLPPALTAPPPAAQLPKKRYTAKDRLSALLKRRR